MALPVLLHTRFQSRRHPHLLLIFAVPALPRETNDADDYKRNVDISPEMRA